MKKTILTFFCAIIAFVAVAQAPEAARWSTSVKMLSSDEGVVKMKMTVADGWHVYGPDLPKGGPVAMTFDFKQSAGVKFVGTPVPSVKATVVYDDAFGMDLPYWSGAVTFEQKFKVIDAQSAAIVGSIRYQGCNGETCAPPKTKKINLKIPKSTK